jgi:hypothetical protein
MSSATARVKTIVRLALIILLASGAPESTSAQAEGAEVRPAEEIPADMPPPPDDAPAAEAPPVVVTESRPPHPETPEPLEEQQPSAETLASTSYHWLPGHWIWTGQQFEWMSGRWIYKVKGMILVPPRWEWDGDQWVFHHAGWAKPGTYEVVYRPTPAPGEADVIGGAETPPQATTQIVEPQQTTTTVYVWTGFYVPPLIVYPIWHPWYHYHWYHRHWYYVRPPAYRHPYYGYARTHRPPPPPRRPPPSSRPPAQPSTRPAQPSIRPAQPSTRPSQPSTRPAQPSTRPAHGGRGRRR